MNTRIQFTTKQHMSQRTMFDPQMPNLLEDREHEIYLNNERYKKKKKLMTWTCNTRGKKFNSGYILKLVLEYLLMVGQEVEEKSEFTFQTWVWSDQSNTHQGENCYKR